MCPFRGVAGRWGAGDGAGEAWKADGAGHAASWDCRWLPARGRSQTSWVTRSVFSYKGNESFSIKQENRSGSGSGFVYVCVHLWMRKLQKDSCCSVVKIKSIFPGFKEEHAWNTSLCVF